MTNDHKPIPADLSTRAKNALHLMGVTDLSEFAGRAPLELLQYLQETKDIGHVTAYEIVGAARIREARTKISTTSCAGCGPRAREAATVLKRFKELEARLEKLAETSVTTSKPPQIGMTLVSGGHPKHS